MFISVTSNANLTSSGRKVKVMPSLLRS